MKPNVSSESLISCLSSKKVFRISLICGKFKSGLILAILNSTSFRESPSYRERITSALSKPCFSNIS